MAQWLCFRPFWALRCSLQNIFFTKMAQIPQYLGKFKHEYIMIDLQIRCRQIKGNSSQFNICSCSLPLLLIIIVSPKRVLQQFSPFVFSFQVNFSGWFSFWRLRFKGCPVSGQVPPNCSLHCSRWPPPGRWRASPRCPTWPWSPRQTRAPHRRRPILSVDVAGLQPLHLWRPVCFGSRLKNDSDCGLLKVFNVFSGHLSRLFHIS